MVIGWTFSFWYWYTTCLDKNMLMAVWIHFITFIGFTLQAFEVAFWLAEWNSQDYCDRLIYLYYNMAKIWSKIVKLLIIHVNNTCIIYTAAHRKNRLLYWHTAITSSLTYLQKSGHDMARKKLLLDRQKQGKVRLRAIGKVRVQKDTFIKVRVPACLQIS